MNDKCLRCKLEFGSKNSKGSLVKKDRQGLCKRCFVVENKAVKVCKNCGNTMIVGTQTGLCPLCRLEKSHPKTKKRLEKPLPQVDDETFELIRRLLIRYKLGMSMHIDTFRVIDVYMSLNENTSLLDTLTEETQLREMLKNLKLIWEHNILLKKDPNYKPIKPKVYKATDDMRAYSKNWYNNSPKSYKNRCKAKWQ